MKLLKFLKKPKQPKKPSLLVVRQISGDSMLPTLRPGFMALGSGRFKALAIGDVVIVRHGGLEKIKRIADIKDDRLYLRGDNEAQSTDSRSFGWLHRSVVIAKVIWPKRQKTPRW